MNMRVFMKKPSVCEMHKRKMWWCRIANSSTTVCYNLLSITAPTSLGGFSKNRIFFAMVDFFFWIGVLLLLLIIQANISRKGGRDAGIPSWAAGFSHHDGLKEKSEILVWIQFMISVHKDFIQSKLVGMYGNGMRSRFLRNSRGFREV